MNKTYKGWELLKAIADGEIKEGTKIKTRPIEGIEDIYEYDGDDFINEYNQEQLTSEISIGSLVDADIELISEPTEKIYIQDIEEMDYLGYSGEYYDEIDENRSVINTLIKAIKQLDNQIKEKE